MIVNLEFVYLFRNVHINEILSSWSVFTLALAPHYGIVYRYTYYLYTNTVSALVSEPRRQHSLPYRHFRRQNECGNILRSHHTIQNMMMFYTGSPRLPQRSPLGCYYYIEWSYRVTMAWMSRGDVMSSTFSMFNDPQEGSSVRDEISSPWH
jgi:hypothetical protein